MEEKIIEWINNNIELKEIVPLLPSSIGYKPDEIQDTYHAYDKANLIYLIDSCNAILKLKPAEKVILQWKSEYDLQLNELNKNYPIPVIEFKEIVNSINNAFFRLESYINGTLKEYKYFGFNDAFTILFVVTKEQNNFTYNNCKLIDQYWFLTGQLRNDYDDSNFENEEVYENVDFIKDIEEIDYLNDKRVEDFNAFTTQDEIDEMEKKFSISNIIKDFDTNNKTSVNDINVNPINKNRDIPSFNSIKDICAYINNALLQLHRFLYEEIPYTEDFDFKHAFNSLLDEIVKLNNYTEDNLFLISKYSEVIYNLKVKLEDDCETVFLLNYLDKIEALEDDFVYINDSLIDFLNDNNMILKDEKKYTIKDMILGNEFNKTISQKNAEEPKSNLKNLPNAYTLTIPKHNKLSVLTDAFNYLKDNNFIINTDLKDFRRIFDNKAPVNKIVWLAGIEALAYFVKYLHSQNRIKDLGQQKWEVTSTLFVDENNNSFNKSAFRWQKKPKTLAVKIETAVDFLK